VLIARELPIVLDPPAVARRFIDLGMRHVALLHAAEPASLLHGRWSFITAEPDRITHRLDPLSDDPDFDRGATGDLAGVPRWIGVVPYESRRALEGPASIESDRRPASTLVKPTWRRYPAVIAVDHLAGRTLAVGTDLRTLECLVAALGQLPDPARAPLVLEVTDDEAPARHEERILRAKEILARGDLLQVTLARRLRLQLAMGDPLTLYLKLARRAPTPFGAYLELDRDITAISTSPELLLRAEPALEMAHRSKGFGRLFTAPIKGTRPRGQDAGEDAALARELDRDPNERAELSTIVDAQREDLTRVAEAGSVRLVQGPRVVTHRTVHHGEAWLTARARASLDREEILRALVPSSSVTGAPKARAMVAIAALESARRGLYAGGLGFVAQDGGMTLSMAIRTAVLDGREGVYWMGSGITSDSDPAHELEETRWKALQLVRAASPR